MNTYDEYEEEIDLLEVWNNLLKKWKIGVIIVCVCAALGLFGSLVYNKLNYVEPQAVDGINLTTTTTTTTTYTIITTNDISYSFYNAVYSEDGLTNITANNFIAKYNTTSYKNDIVEKLDLNNKYGIDVGALESLVSVYQSNGIITISVKMDRDWYLNKQESKELTNKEAIDEISSVQNKIVEKIIKDIESDISDLGTYDELGNPVTKTTTQTIENVDATTTTTETPVVEDKTVSVKKYTLIAIVLGVVIYCGYVFVLTLLDKTLKTSEDIKRYIDYPVLAYVNNDEGYKTLAITLSNITSSKVFNVTSPVSDISDFTSKLADSLNGLNKKCVVANSLDEVKGKKTTSYILVNSNPINTNGDTISVSKNTDETILVCPVSVFSKDDLTVTKEIIKNNNIDVTGVVIVGVDK